MRSLIMDPIRRCVLTLAAVLTLSAQAQVASPGNVEHPALWLHPATMVDTATFSIGSANGPLLQDIVTAPASGGIVAMNTHAIPNLAYSSARWSISDSVAPAGTSLFLIEKLSDVEERTLWSLEVADSGRLVLTTHRAADLSTGKHLMNDAASSGPVKLVAHHHRAKTRIEGPAYFRLGHTAPIPAVPTPAFEGSISEVLFYDRVLSPKEQSRVSSYLAIKYGITLSNEDYVASDQRRVWSNRTNAAFAHNVLAIAHDTAAVLDQRQSTSSNEEGFLLLGLDTITRWHPEHPNALPNGHYLITGDDGRARSWAERQQGQPQLTERTWHLQRTGGTLLNTRLRLATGMFLNQPENGGSYWLLIDRSGQGEFGPTNTEVVKALVLADNIAEFQDVVWDADGTGSDRFRFATGGPLIPLTWVDAPTCEPPALGTLTVRVPGGDAPVMCRLQGIGHDATFESQVSPDTVTSISGIAPGEYEMTITDASGYSITDHLWIQPTDAPVIPLQARYELKAEVALVLDASVGDGFASYEWQHAGMVVGNEPRLPVERPGNYDCTVVVDGCPARASTQVYTSAPAAGIAIGVMPNPTLSGDFIVQVSLPANTDAVLTIASMHGTLVRQRTLRGQEFHRIQEHIGDAGEYIISVRTSDGQRFTRVIVL